MSTPAYKLVLQTGADMTTTWSNGTRDSSSWSNSNADSSSWTLQSLDIGKFFILLEDGISYLLLESGGRIIVEPTQIDASWSNQSES